MFIDQSPKPRCWPRWQSVSLRTDPQAVGVLLRPHRSMVQIGWERVCRRAEPEGERNFPRKACPKDDRAYLGWLVKRSCLVSQVGSAHTPAGLLNNRISQPSLTGRGFRFGFCSPNSRSTAKERLAAHVR